MSSWNFNLNNCLKFFFAAISAGEKLNKSIQKGLTDQRDLPAFGGRLLMIKLNDKMRKDTAY